jgi:hypothetical protein
MSFVDKVVAIEFFVAMFAPVVFIVLYNIPPIRWHRSWEGRVIMAQKLLFTGFLLNGVLYFAVGPDYPGRDAFRLVLFTAMVPTLWGMAILLGRSRLEQWRKIRELRRELQAEPRDFDRA